MIITDRVTVFRHTPGHPLIRQQVAMRTMQPSCALIPPSAAEFSWRGIGAAAGVARGQVRRIRSEAQAAALGPDDVAVCPRLTPAIAARLGPVAAVVAEAGGPLCAGATLLRERDVPAVVLPGASASLRPGQRVTIDGRRGTVLADPPRDPTGNEGEV